MNLTGKHLILIRHNEIALKGKNRPEFERRLSRNLLRLADRANFENVRSLKLSGRYFLVIESEAQAVQIMDSLRQVPGVAGLAPCDVVPLSGEDAVMEKLAETSLKHFEREQQKHGRSLSFGLRTRRVDKKFATGSYEMAKFVAAKIFGKHPDAKVDLKTPDIRITIEVREKHAIVYSGEERGAGGLPVDNTQRVVCLLSGGIDSPVAAYQVLRRGCSLVLVHFHSKPFTSEASINKVKRLAARLREHAPGTLELWLVPLLEIQKMVRDRCTERFRTIHYRRFMMQLAQEIAHRRDARAVVTGEALGQVASQTLSNLEAVQDGLQLPVLRPLISMDKEEIMRKAKELKTYEISIEPHDDTCVLFAPKKPATQGKLQILREEMERMPRYQLLFDAIDKAEKILI